MRSGVESYFGLAAICLALILGTAAPALCDDANTPPLTQIGLVAFKSLDALNAFSKSTGLPLPAGLSAEAIENQFTFIGKGGLATDRPIGVILYGGRPLNPEQMIAFVFPVKPTAATVKSLKARGALRMRDYHDSFFLGQAGVRRTDDYLIYSPAPLVAATVSDVAVQDWMRTDDALLHVSGDLKAFREIMPNQYSQLLAWLQSNPDWRALGGLAAKSLDALERIDLGVNNSDQGLKLSLAIAPWKLSPVAKAQRPVMPPRAMGRLDLGVRLAAAFPMLPKWIESMKAGAVSADGKPFTDEQKKQLDIIFYKLANIILTPDATSVGVDITSHQPVFYIVQHWPTSTDVSHEVDTIGDALKALTPEGSSSTRFMTQSYVCDGLPVLRVLGMNGGQPIGALDIVQRGNDVYMAIAFDIQKHINRLLPPAGEGRIREPVSAMVDLKQIMDELPEMTNSPLATLSADSIKQIAELLSDQKVTVSSYTDHDTTELDIMVTKGLVQNMPKLLMALEIGPGVEAERAHNAQVAIDEKLVILGGITYYSQHKAWPDTLDQLVDSVGGKDGLAKMLADTRLGALAYRRPFGTMTPDKAVVIYEPYLADAQPLRVVVGYADGHVAAIAPAQLQRELGGINPAITPATNPTTNPATTSPAPTSTQPPPEK